MTVTVKQLISAKIIKVEEMTMKFSEKIVRLRKIKGITQDELASAVGVSRQAVYKWECGQSYPEVAKLIEIKALFGISIDDLLDDTYEIAMPDKKRKKRAVKPKAQPVEQPAPEAAEPVAEIEASVSEEEITVVEAEVLPTAEKSEESGYTEIASDKEEMTDEAEKIVEEVEKAEEEEIAPKKRGFFSRLFGRK